MKVEYLSFGFSGLVLMGIALAGQWSSMDLNTYSLLEYLARDAALPAWWAVVGTPFWVGFCALIVAVWGIRARVTSRRSLLVFGGLIVVGAVIAPFSTLAGLLTLVPALACFVGAAIKARKPNHSPQTDAAKPRG